MENPFFVIEQKIDRLTAEIKELKKPEQPRAKQEKYLTMDQVAEILSVSRVTLWSWDKKGILESHRIGNLRRYKQSDIEKMMADSTPVAQNGW